jgi:hypothetical protein
VGVNQQCGHRIEADIHVSGNNHAPRLEYVKWLLDAVQQHLDKGERVSGDVQKRCQIVAAPSRHDSHETSSWNNTCCDIADNSVSAHRNDDVSCARCRRRNLNRVFGILGFHDSHIRTGLGETLSQRFKPGSSLTPAGDRIDYRSEASH